MFNEDEIKDQVDEFNQVMDDMLDLRRASARELAEAAAWLVKITEGYAEAYREAVKSGWTPAQLRKAKFPEPGHRKRRKREQKRWPMNQQLKWSKPARQMMVMVLTNFSRPFYSRQLSGSRRVVSMDEPGLFSRDQLCGVR